VTHGLGALLSVAGLAVLVVLAALQGDAWRVVAVSVYGGSLVALYSASTLYHSARRVRLKYFLEILDHSAIYLLIAGSYTPFMLISLRHSIGWVLLSVVWGLALIGIAFKPLLVHRLRRLSPVLYLAMGWLSVVAIPEMLVNIPPIGLILIAAGGISYSVGIIFYAWQKLPFNHAVWHVFVLGGSVCHYFAVLSVVLPASG
jgi:hemolysin III